MNIYVCIPESIYIKLSEEKENTISNTLKENICDFYNEIDVSIIGQKNLKNIEVYVMGKSKIKNSDNDITNIISKSILSTIDSNYNNEITVKLNYSIFNPSFRPKTDCEKAKENLDSKSNEFNYEKLAENYRSEKPRYTFSQVVLPDKTISQIEKAIGILKVEKKVFDDWGLRSIIPEATSALNFYGPPGTGKSMCAEAIAEKLGKKILKATYSDIESKYHGEGPKMVKAIFKAAERDDAVLFIDESDSLLSKRLTNVSDGSAQAINSMRSQLLISLENYKGIVIFASNLVVNYDKAFLSRLINIEFVLPTSKERKTIWNNHIKGENIHIPLSTDVDLNYLSDKYEFCGREIKNSVKNACVSTALENRNCVTQNDLILACEQTQNEKRNVCYAHDYSNVNEDISTETQNLIKEQLTKKL